MAIENLVYLKADTKLYDFSENWDIFISAYNGSDRIQTVFSRVIATRKIWVVVPEYKYAQEDCAELVDAVSIEDGINEATLAHKIFEYAGVSSSKRICIDITGFMRPHILALAKYLFDLGIDSYFVLYTEPEQYRRKEHTPFSGDDVECVRQVLGYEGVHSDDVSGDLLFIGMGYDDGLVSRVAADKEGARLIKLLSLPSLSADMYQESILRLDRAGIAATQDEGSVFFAPANDPFVVAAELSSTLRQIERRSAVTNVYLCPLATKVQALGFALFYLRELRSRPASVLFPFSNTYERETSKGVGKSWLYHVEAD